MGGYFNSKITEIMKNFELIQIHPEEKVKIPHLTERYFFRDDEKEYCYRLQTHIRYMRRNKLKSMNLWLAKREINTPYLYCKYFRYFIYKKDNNCGEGCLLGYKPKNEKNGGCIHRGFAYERTDICFTLKIK